MISCQIAEQGESSRYGRRAHVESYPVETAGCNRRHRSSHGLVLKLVSFTVSLALAMILVRHGGLNRTTNGRWCQGTQ